MSDKSAVTWEDIKHASKMKEMGDKGVDSKLALVVVDEFEAYCSKYGKNVNSQEVLEDFCKGWLKELQQEMERELKFT